MQKSIGCWLTLSYFFLGVGAVVAISWSVVCIFPFRKLFGNGFTVPQLIFGILTILAIALAIVGIIGFQKRSLKITLAFSVFVLLMSIGFILVGAMVYFELQKIKPSIEGRIFKFYVEYNDTTDSDPYDNIQQQFECCGYHNYTDWYYYNSSRHRLNMILPTSCCQATSAGESLRNDLCRNIGIGFDYLRHKGCYTKGYHQAFMGALPLIIIAFLIALMGVPCSVLSFIESIRMKNKNSDDDSGSDKAESDNGDEDDDATNDDDNG